MTDFYSLEQLLVDFNKAPPIAAADIGSFELQSALSLPSDYSSFLRRTNGGEGFIGESYTILWKLEDLIPFNRDYEVGEFAPGLLLFGSNGGGEAFAFDMRSDPWRVVQVPFVGMDLCDCVEIGQSFTAFLAHLFTAKEA